MEHRLRRHREDTLLAAPCTLTLQFEGFEDMQLHAPIKIAPEELDATV
ncbi:hypothetical protein D187_005251 [Cystobacter fuscus DSM 2262]|uniref:Uncharacterized protein n=1 Tax=Cystobacter fuscus (strain ATCC 25194 / DSM 2262 / NBRC 100088 / M29) TaxID=1242864 RepID=S9PNV3_CYSF2|nr:hypothetical protein D187_005251 [Cystobacter fuscus DSM 2262]